MAKGVDRKQRLAAALRENLHRRKQQQRDRRKNDPFLADQAVEPVSATGADQALRPPNRTE